MKKTGLRGNTFHQIQCKWELQQALALEHDSPQSDWCRERGMVPPPTQPSLALSGQAWWGGRKMRWEAGGGKGPLSPHCAMHILLLSLPL